MVVYKICFSIRVQWHPQVSCCSAWRIQICLDEEQTNNSDEWFDEVDKNVFIFRGKVDSWLKEINEDIRCSKASSNTKTHSSRPSTRISNSDSSPGSNSGRIKGKIKLSELFAAFLKKHQQVDSAVQRIRIQKKTY